MFDFNDLISLGDKITNYLIIPLWNFLVTVIQLPFGLGSAGKYAPAFYLLLLFTIIVILGYKLRFGFAPFVAEVQADFDRVNRKLAKKKRRSKR